MTFVHLHCHTEYSFLDGCIRPADLARKASALGMPAAAITDHGGMFGVIPFFKACKKEGIKPIIGCEIYVCEDMRKKEPGTTTNHLVLLARDTEGYRNLMKIVSAGHLEGKYFKPRVDHAFIRQHRHGLIGLSACLAGELSRAALKDDYERGRKIAALYAEMFDGKFFLELQENGISAQRRVNSFLLRLAARDGYELVATNDCHYLNAEDQQTHDLMLRIQTRKTLTDEDAFSFESRTLFYKTPDEMRTAFTGYDRCVLDNTLEIAEMCNVDLEFGKSHFPVFNLPEGQTAEGLLERQAREGLSRRFEGALSAVEDRKPYQERLQYELEMINQTGFAQYLLIVQDFIGWAKDHAVPVGPGRGSGAGSLVAYALRITNIDPLAYSLLFERFINAERVSLPDIDVDFCEKRREMVIEYMTRTYGRDHVAQVCAIGTMQARSAIKDVVRAMGLKPKVSEPITRLLPGFFSITEALNSSPELKKLYGRSKQRDLEFRKLIASKKAVPAALMNADRISWEILDYARRLEGMARNATTHGAGVVCSPSEMTDYVPLCLDKNGKVIAQYDMKGVEDIGLVKFDFLGLRTLTVMDMALQNIRLMGGTPPDLDRLPLDDLEVFSLYSRGDMLGVFQMESAGMRKYLKMLKPGRFEDIIAMCALYRPGPLRSGMVDTFIRRKQGLEDVNYFGLDERLESILASTYGVIVYQEQVMQIAQAVAGYSLGKADLLRRAMGKKKAEEMAAQRKSFLAGAEQNGIPREKATVLFALMERFAEYGFNKSHSAAYALISYQTAYLKTHFKTAFLAALLSSEIGRQEKLYSYISELRAEGLHIERPDILQSRREFTPVREGTIRFGLGGIKSVGESAVNEILSWQKRVRAGAIPVPRSVVHCLSYMNMLSSTVIEALAKCGALDGFEPDRALICHNIEAAQVMAKKMESLREKASPLLGEDTVIMPACVMKTGLGLEFLKAPGENGKKPCGMRHLAVWIPSWDKLTKLNYEREYTGFYVSGGHPFEECKEELQRLYPGAEGFVSLEEHADGDRVLIGAYIAQAALKVSKSGNTYLSMQLEDDTGRMEAFCFSRALDSWAGTRLARAGVEGERIKLAEVLAAGAIVVLEAILKAEDSDDEPDDPEARRRVLKLFVNDAVELPGSKIEKTETRFLTVEVDSRIWSEAAERSLEMLLETHPGDMPVVVEVRYADHDRQVRPSTRRVTNNPAFEQALREWRRQFHAASRPLTSHRNRPV